MGTHYHEFLRDDGVTKIEVTFEVESYGCASNSWDEPGEAMELGIIHAIDVETGEVLVLTEAENERMNLALLELDPDELSAIDD